MPQLKLFNTATRKKEVFRPLNPKKTTLYTCGPTVYDFAHIGNFRTYIFEDLLKRTICYLGWEVEHVMNITDVDDKTIKGAVAKGFALNDYTQPFKKAFFEDLEALNIVPADHYPEATAYIPQMIGMIQKLIDKGIAYQGADNSIYYAIHKFPNYGCLSHLNLDELESGASERIAADEYDKENISDFVLWKAYDPDRDGVIYWESSLGPGRPGWHLECSAMAMEILGESLDLHCGGIDNMFPHHENEIAQSEAVSGKPFARFWLHAEHLIVESKKMSKSLGNFFTLRDLLDKKYEGRQIRYLLLQTHYKTQLNFTFAGLDAARNSLHRLNDFIHRMQTIAHDEYSLPQTAVRIEHTRNRFRTALADDLNISEALAAIFDFVREGNAIADDEKLSVNDAESILKLFREFDQILGVLDFHQDKESVPEEILEALEKRIQARKEKKWELADTLRNFIASKGYVIEDSPSGSRVKKI